MMPTAIKVISTLCILFTSIFVANLMFMYKSQISLPIAGIPLLSFINLFAVGVLVMITLVLLLRGSRLVGFIRVLVYTLLLVLGFNILLMFQLLSIYSVLTIALSIVVIVFLIGVRGYLNSEHAVRYFSR